MVRFDELSLRMNFQDIGKEEDIFEKAELLADSGFHTEKNMEMLAEEGIGAYVADNRFRKHAPRFADYERNKPGKTLLKVNRSYLEQRISPLTRKCDIASTLPASAYKRSGADEKAFRFKGTQTTCVSRELRAKCILQKSELFGL
jgi:hypothetical protein